MVGLIIILILVLVFLGLGLTRECQVRPKISIVIDEPSKPEVSLAELPTSDPSNCDIQELTEYLRGRKYSEKQIKKIVADIRRASVDAGLVVVKYKNMYEPSKESVDNEIYSW